MGIQFSAEDMEVIKKCEIESLIQRSIPIGTFMGVSTFAAIKRGLISSSRTTPKIVGACILGYILGKLSYQQECAEKLMRLPNSQVGEMLRRRKGGFMDNFSPDGGLSMAPFTSRAQPDIYTDEGQKPVQPQHRQGSLDFDRPVTFSGLDDTYRPTLDSPERNFNDNLPNEPPKSTTSYDELRRQNREEYNRKLGAPFQSPVAPPQADQFVIRRAPEPRSNDEFGPIGGGVKNRYGDEMR